jgi:hypothetical protein
MEDIMHCGQVFWQTELIGHFSMPCENLIRTNVASEEKKKIPLQNLGRYIDSVRPMVFLEY